MLADQLKNVFVGMLPVVYEAIAGGNEILNKYEINSRIRRLHFFTQCAHETSGFTRIVENLSYSANRLVQVWHNRFGTGKGKLDPHEYEFNPELLGNAVYDGRMGNGSGEGYKFRGRGLIMTTGRDNYQYLNSLNLGDCRAFSVGKAFSDDIKKLDAARGHELAGNVVFVPYDFVYNPDLLLRPSVMLEAAAAFWKAGGCNAASDRNDIEKVTRLVNGGIIGLEDRIAIFAKVKNRVDVPLRR